MTLTEKSSVAEIKAAWNAELRATRPAARLACDTGFLPKLRQIEILACNEQGRLSGGELTYLEGVNDITEAALAQWFASAREMGATYIALDGHWDAVSKNDEDDYDPLDVWASVDIALTAQE